MSNETAMKIRALIDTHNYRQIGEQLGLTRSRVQQIAKKHGMDRSWARNLKAKGEIITCDCGATFLRKKGNRTQCYVCRYRKS